MTENDQQNTRQPIDHAAVNAWMRGNGWLWADAFSNLSKTVEGHWFKPEHPFVSQDLAAEMWRMSEGRLLEVVNGSIPLYWKPENEDEPEMRQFARGYNDGVHAFARCIAETIGAEYDHDNREIAHQPKETT